MDDGFDSLGRTKLIRVVATNRPDTLDPALLRPGRLDRKIKVSLPNKQARLDILKIHAVLVNKGGDIDYEAIIKLSEGFNGADLRNVVTEAGMFAILYSKGRSGIHQPRRPYESSQGWRGEKARKWSIRRNFFNDVHTPPVAVFIHAS